MAVIGLDDTDSRVRGMCTTYLAARLASRLREEPTGSSEASRPGTPAVSRPVLVRLNPAVPHKTRGNAALAVHADVPADRAFELARDELESAAETDDPDTHPGLVVAPGSPHEVPDDVVDFSRSAMAELLELDDALDLIEARGYRSAGWKTGRGRIGALAALGATRALDDPTHGLADRSYELIAYREPARWGTPRAVDEDAVFAAAEAGYPAAWDTVDRVEDEAVCVPHTPGPVLYGVRGDDPGAVRAVASRIDAEPVDRAALFVTNQGTDAHLRDGAIGSLDDGGAYRVDGVVAGGPETRRGGHVFVPLRRPGEPRTEVADGGAPVGATSETAADRATVECAAFEPTKRFRDRVRALRPGDRITACGEVADGTLKLEKFAVRDLVETELATPECPDCGRRMESAGAGQGYRCRDCGTSAEGKVERRIRRELERGWYEVPPVARRHIAKPLVRGGFDGPVHPER
ncbi:MAG TPA: tRNA(Ile)(2)-agmatinylcytidine synthase [Halobacteriales archaeon]|nr:tRNA(Ile)(2)-agmatinylcytidine synthase [Halobacteriales archaeon]